LALVLLKLKFIQIATLELVTLEVSFRVFRHILFPCIRMFELKVGPNFYFFFDDDFLEDFLRGTLAPSFRACESPIAIACFLLVTFLPDRPLFSVPSFRSHRLLDFFRCLLAVLGHVCCSSNCFV
jgi:hypothetical protein